MVAQMVAIIEAAAQRIGLTIGNTMEALYYITFRGKADQLYCYLSPYAQDVFNLADRVCP